MKRTIAKLTSLVALLGVALLTYSCSPNCDKCEQHCSNCQEPPAGGDGIPYATCTVGNPANCNQTNQKVIDPQLELVPAGCKLGWCRLGYANGKVCKTGDTIECGLGNGTKGRASCSGGSWGACQASMPCN